MYKCQFRKNDTLNNVFFLIINLTLAKQHVIYYLSETEDSQKCELNEGEYHK